MPPWPPLVKDRRPRRTASAIIRLLSASFLILTVPAASHEVLTADLEVGSSTALSAAQWSASRGPNESLFHGYVNVQSFGAKGDGETDDTAAFKRALASASDGSTIFVPPGTYRITQDLSYPATRSISWRGAGLGSVLSFISSGLILTGGTEGTEKRLTIEALKIQRQGSAGAALSLDGATSVGLSRWALRDLHIVSVAGAGIYIEGAWIGTMDNIVVTRSKVGVQIELDRESRNTSMNALTVTGGEVQACIDGWRIKGVAGLTMLGHTVEGNVRGITATNTPRGINIDGGYFEHNRAYDVSFEGPTAGYGNSIRDSVFFAPGGDLATPSSILLDVGKNFTIEGNSFIGYTSSAVRITDTVGITTGVVRENYLNKTPAEVSGARREFGRM